MAEEARQGLKLNKEPRRTLLGLFISGRAVPVIVGKSLRSINSGNIGEERNMTQQVLQETLQMWLDDMATLHIDILGMHDIAAPRLQETNNVPSTLFLLEGENASLTELWHLTKQLEAL